MAAIVVNTTDTFEQWRVKTNQLSLDVFDAIRNIDEDITPSLGGDLNLTSTTGNAPGSYDIVGTGNINIDGDIECTGDITGGGSLTSPSFTVNGSSGDIQGFNWTYAGATSTMTITGSYVGTQFEGKLSGTIADGTTGVTQSGSDNSQKIATTAYTDAQVLSSIPTHLLSGLQDVTLSNPLNQHLLMYDTATSQWLNGSIVAAGVPNQSFTVAMAIALGY